jgi:transcriptional regulator with XRE-family HTH domain
MFALMPTSGVQRARTRGRRHRVERRTSRRPIGDQPGPPARYDLRMGQDGRWEGFATYLQEAIDDAGFATPTQFARRVNTDPSVVLRWLNGSARPTIRLLERVAPVLGVDINTMVAAAYPEASTAPPAKVAPRRGCAPPSRRNWTRCWRRRRPSTTASGSGSSSSSRPGSAPSGRRCAAAGLARVRTIGLEVEYEHPVTTPGTDR